MSKIFFPKIVFQAYFSKKKSMRFCTFCAPGQCSVSCSCEGCIISLLLLYFTFCKFVVLRYKKPPSLKCLNRNKTAAVKSRERSGFERPSNRETQSILKQLAITSANLSLAIGSFHLTVQTNTICC